MCNILLERVGWIRIPYVTGRPLTSDDPVRSHKPIVSGAITLFCVSPLLLLVGVFVLPDNRVSYQQKPNNRILLLPFINGSQAQKIRLLDFWPAKDTIYTSEPKSPKATIIRHGAIIRLLLVWQTQQQLAHKPKSGSYKLAADTHARVGRFGLAGGPSSFGHAVLGVWRTLFSQICVWVHSGTQKRNKVNKYRY